MSEECGDDVLLALLSDIGAVLSLGPPTDAEKRLRALRKNPGDRSALLARVRDAEATERRCRPIIAERDALRSAARSFFEADVVPEGGDCDHCGHPPGERHDDDCDVAMNAEWDAIGRLRDLCGWKRGGADG